MHRSATLLAFLLLTVGLSAAEPQVITIKTLHAQMRYDVTDFTVKPGAEVKIIFENVDDMPHNLIILQAGTDAVALATKMLEKPEEALKRDYLPDDPRVLAHSKSVQPKTKDEFVFKAPAKVGVYPYVCTFPGHAAIMNGKMRVSLSPPGLKDLKFALYQGSWNKLPDFAALKVHREGEIADGLIQIKLDDYKNQFGIVFTGKLNAPKEGDYSFSIAGDDGVRLLIDGKKVVEHDGVHGATEIKEGRTKLTAGVHEVRMEYFQGTGEAEIYLAWKGADFPNTALSKWLHPEASVGGKKKKAGKTGIPLIVGTEPVVYRNFIANAGGRPIGVGYPGGFNLAWSAAQMNLALLWRGEFIDAALHWIDRGGGEQTPLGDDHVRPTGEVSVPFAVLNSAETAWPRVDKLNLPEDYDWKGYTLDAKRFPTFSYVWKGVKVTDRFDTEGAAASGGKLIRTLRTAGTIPANAFFRVAAGALQADGDGFTVDGALRVAVTGAQIAGPNLLVPARAEIKITYTWPPAKDGDVQ
jgi:azurin